MTYDDLANLCRLAIDDTDPDDPLWTDLEIASYADGAQKEFARRTDYFSDASTTEIVEIPFVAGDILIPLDPRVIKIRHAKLLLDPGKLVPSTYADMETQSTNSTDYASPYTFGPSLNWEESTGTPRYLITDVETDMLQLAPIPVVDDTVKMMVYRLPLEDITEDVQCLEVVETDFQRGLLFYMKYMAYGKNDVDTYDERLQGVALSNHEDFITKAKRQLRRERFSSTRGVVRYGGL